MCKSLSTQGDELIGDNTCWLHHCFDPLHISCHIEVIAPIIVPVETGSQNANHWNVQLDERCQAVNASFVVYSDTLRQAFDGFGILRGPLGLSYQLGAPIVEEFLCQGCQLLQPVIG